ncbi:myo-inositol-1(or 4)-monophosphatase [Desulfosalsimonas propionicica]|uniref:Inositol-1-monophosphatase n=1 Tax=Desulfosalsimonas propionicica TaxID=332175 RepID=A0A7W0C9Y0_9BACT|nr:inositol monophosphatase family protein [Desulfosalsimonas propionicica]MBA2881784.1 myo-inositol-1(or 4)-monophosphatase [Desulfosalsimonas propionicica]
MDLNLIKNTAVGAAYKSGEILRSHLGNFGEVSKKGPKDLVTAADIASEKQIIKSIQSRFADHKILAEESSAQNTGTDGHTWIIDPLDGTTNFAHQVPVFSVSIAFAENGQLRAGVVLNPMTGELFTAVQGQGAQLNGRAISVSDCRQVSESLLVTGFPYDIKENPGPYMDKFARCLSAAIGVRRLGSAALDLCFVACGRFEGFWEQGLKPWDTAAGTLIAREAGARVTDFSGTAYDIDKKELLATNGHIHEDLRSLLT